MIAAFLFTEPQILIAEDQGSEMDHSEFEELGQDFNSGDAVTKTCLECHEETDQQLRQTQHWKWHVDDNPAMGKGGLVVNNFCISSNKLGDAKCIECHIGWNAQQGEVNCLLCHSLKKMNWNEAFEDINAFIKEGDKESLEIVEDIRAELKESITAIGQPGAEHCGACHFYSGGGDGVKRGDLDSSLVDPPRELDVHLSKEGAEFSCRDCHSTSEHKVPGRLYYASVKAQHEARKAAEEDSYLSCDSCHSSEPHDDAQLNKHFEKISCQTCHIPKFARKNPTKVWWDWSKAGQLKDDKPYDTKDQYGKKNYMTIKGEFRWEKNITPHYAWYDGSMKNLTLKDPVVPGEVVDVQVPNGKPGDPNSKIHPFKIHRGKQPYDSKLNRILAPMLSGDKGYWTTLDWPEALKAGMEATKMPFSGEYDFIESRFMYPLHHTIAPKEMALACSDCHKQAGSTAASRLAGVPGIDIPELAENGKPLKKQTSAAKQTPVAGSDHIARTQRLVFGFGIFVIALLAYAVLRTIKKKKKK